MRTSTLESDSDYLSSTRRISRKPMAASMCNIKVGSSENCTHFSPFQASVHFPRFDSDSSTPLYTTGWFSTACGRERCVCMSHFQIRLRPRLVEFSKFFVCLERLHSSLVYRARVCEPLSFCNLVFRSHSYALTCTIVFCNSRKQT